MPASARARVDALFESAEPDEEAIAEVVAIVREHGGLDYARRRADQYSREAEEALAELPEGPSKASLLDAIGYVVERRW
jgi:octaprenyl-diphosphate synthase